MNSVDPDSSVGQSGELAVGDQVQSFERYDYPKGKTLQDLCARDPIHKNKQAFILGVAKGVGGGRAPAQTRPVEVSDPSPTVSSGSSGFASTGRAPPPPQSPRRPASPRLPDPRRSRR